MSWFHPQVRGVNGRIVKLKDRLLPIFASDGVHRHLYPASVVPFRIRKYEPSDRDSVLRLYDSNAPGRFPEGHRPCFERFPLDCDDELFVAVHPTEGVIACGGVSSNGPGVHTLCSGLVSPQFQGERIGSTLTLVRLAFATRTEGVNSSRVYVVHKSLTFYERFGYRVCDKWLGEDQREYPVCVLNYLSSIRGSIEGVLAKRGHRIPRSIPLKSSKAVASGTSDVSAEVTGNRVQ